MGTSWPFFLEKYDIELATRILTDTRAQ